MRHLTVLYDGECTLCKDVRRWMSRQEFLVPVEFVSARSGEAQHLYPELGLEELADDLHVIADDQAVYRGAKAFVMCLWALRDYRGWSLRLGEPEMLPYAERYFRWLSKNRSRLTWLGRLIGGPST